MQSHLSRRVFRALINNEPLSFSACRRHRLLHTIPPARVRLSLPSLQDVTRRNLFAFNAAPTTEARPTTLPSERGLKPMADLLKSLKDKARAPPSEVLAKAFQTFFATRVETPGVITGSQAKFLIVTWKHLKGLQSELEERDWQNVFSTENLEKMLFVFSEAQCLPESRAILQNLARYAYLELCVDHGFGPNEISRPALTLYINLLCANGNPEEARAVVVKFWDRLRKVRPSPWLAVLKGFAIKDDLRQVKKVIDDLKEHGMTFDQASHEELIQMLIEQDQFDAVQTVYECPIFYNLEPSLSTMKAVIKYAILKSKFKWASPILESLPQKPDTVYLTLLWEAAHGSGAVALKEKLDSLIAKDPRYKKAIAPATLNHLLEYANTVENPQLAAELSQLVDKWGITPTERTHMLQFESRVQSGDVEQTLEFLQERIDPSTLAQENLPLANRLIKMLCQSEKKDALFQQISSLLDPLFQENVRLEADTLAALTRMLLYRHDWDAVSELLRPRLGTYDSEEKTKVRNALTDFILDPSQSDSDVWDVYELLKVAFPETGVSMRTEIMTSLFKRKRNDLAVLVFGHMRQAENVSQRPKPDTYARCLQGIAQTGDEGNLELVHNMLRLDLEVVMTTRILNGLMLAYAACDQTETSMEMFREVLQSEEGPSNKTLVCFFKVCEKHRNGAHEAMKMMDKIKKLEITVDRPLYHAYIQALAAQYEFDQATEAIDSMEEEIGQVPMRDTIGLFYNAIPFDYWKDQVEEWARKKYPEQWARLVELPCTEQEGEMRFEGIANDVRL
ncbi:hypothetical protein N7474_007103 [Penicillium riverlandense]|uniref:uncharacterized protein n=1 Tax=Penicillium riverlandense TaxID=1903569 RepID=UPI0025468844|nr:uncharacterized protein N7474_007103 [Penicillium riverlandense]KAJ5815326.1 hypothetical protein N7474_007103 [Penicillium riverlandense]